MVKISKDSVYQHFRPDEAVFVDSIYDWVYRVQKSYTPYLTNFLNPREGYIVQSIVGQNEEIKVDFFGGYEGAERQRALISPFYHESRLDNFQIQAMNIDYPSDFIRLSHGQILGSSLSLGLNREKIGDIVTDGEAWQFFIDQSLSDFIRLELNRIGRHSVICQPISLDKLIGVRDDYEEREESLSSLRLDNLVAAAFHLSRSKVKDLIQTEKVKLNWKESTNPAKNLSQSDVVSVRGFGRVMLADIKGKSRKNRFIVRLKVKASKK